jgi:uncharacterized protein (TIGR02246 family)
MPNDRDEQRILKLFEDGDRALIAADAVELERIYADDYVQYDEFGKSRTKGDLIRNLTSGAIRFISMKSTGRQVRWLTEALAIVHGSEEDQIDEAGEHAHVKYVYMDVVIKREEQWQIAASQLARRI